MTKKRFPLPDVYRLLEPGPVVLVTTAARGETGIMAMSWHMMMEFEPPLVGCIISGRNHSFELLRASKECVINIPTVELAPKVVQCGNTSGRRVAKFERFGLTPVASSQVGAPRIEQCYANLECRIFDARWVDRYNLFVPEVVRAWIDPSVNEPKTIHHAGCGAFIVDGETIRLRSKMK